MLRLLPGRKSAVKIFQNSDPFPEFSSHVIDSLFSLHLKLFISDFGLWLSSTENKISKRFLLELHFSLDVFDRTNRTWRVFVTGKHRLVRSKIGYIHH